MLKNIKPMLQGCDLTNRSRVIKVISWPFFKSANNDVALIFKLNTYLGLYRLQIPRKDTKNGFNEKNMKKCGIIGKI